MDIACIGVPRCIIIFQESRLAILNPTLTFRGVVVAGLAFFQVKTVEIE
jgi:hypothetical protein